MPLTAKSPARFLQKQQYSEKSNTGQPGRSEVIRFGKFRIKRYDTTQTECITLPLSFTFSGVGVFNNPKAKFVQCVTLHVIVKLKQKKII